MVDRNKFFLSWLSSWCFKTPKYAFLSSSAKFDLIGKIELYTPDLSLQLFIAKTSSLGPEYPWISYFSVKRQCWTFWENRRVDLDSYIGEIFVSIFVIGRFKKPRGWVWWNSNNLEKFLVFLTTLLYILKKPCEVLFISENKLSVLEKLPTTISRPLRSSRADWHQHQKVRAQKLETIWK